LLEGDPARREIQVVQLVIQQMVQLVMVQPGGPADGPAGHGPARWSS